MRRRGRRSASCSSSSRRWNASRSRPSAWRSRCDSVSSSPSVRASTSGTSGRTVTPSRRCKRNCRRLRTSATRSCPPVRTCESASRAQVCFSLSLSLINVEETSLIIFRSARCPQTAAAGCRRRHSAQLRPCDWPVRPPFSPPFRPRREPSPTTASSDPTRPKSAFIRRLGYACMKVALCADERNSNSMGGVGQVEEGDSFLSEPRFDLDGHLAVCIVAYFVVHPRLQPHGSFFPAVNYTRLYRARLGSFRCWR